MYGHTGLNLIYMPWGLRHSPETGLRAPSGSQLWFLAGPRPSQPPAPPPEPRAGALPCSHGSQEGTLPAGSQKPSKSLREDTQLLPLSIIPVSFCPGLMVTRPEDLRGQRVAGPPPGCCVCVPAQGLRCPSCGIVPSGVTPRPPGPRPSSLPAQPEDTRLRSLLLLASLERYAHS